MKYIIKFTLLTLMSYFLYSCNQSHDNFVIVKPEKYEHALRNPMKGFTTRGVSDHPWATLAQTYIRWNELENTESDGIQKIKQTCDAKWEGIESKNIKVIPRVYLHWDGDSRFWPEDMKEMDYSSPQFQERVLRLIKRLGECWDNDPRIAFVEMGIFGKWGEQHSPYPTKEMEILVSDAFAEAFKNKKVSVRRNWERFLNHPYGVYWDSWAHYNQMWGHGNSINELNKTDRYLVNYVGGEVAYDWGESYIQPGNSPTASVAENKHNQFIINSIRWLHCTQLRWIDAYDLENKKAAFGAEKIQKVLGYRFELSECRFRFDKDLLEVNLSVINEGSAPFYYNWPIELSLLDTATHEPVWKSEFKGVDIRKWLPGCEWPDPNWIEKDDFNTYVPDPMWNNSNINEWENTPVVNEVQEEFKVNLSKGTYILSIAIIDPAAGKPSLRFATSNYLKGGKHPLGLINVDTKECFPLPADFIFDNPMLDNSINYAKK